MMRPNVSQLVRFGLAQRVQLGGSVMILLIAVFVMKLDLGALSAAIILLATLGIAYLLRRSQSFTGSLPDTASVSPASIILLGEKSVAGALAADLERSGTRISKLLILPEENVAGFAACVLKASTSDPSAESILVALPGVNQDGFKELLSELMTARVPVRLLPDLDISAFLDSSAEDIRSEDIRLSQGTPLSRAQRRAKRVLDLALASILFLLTLPLMILVAILIKCDSKGPVIFTQTRNGLDNRTFQIYKFRTLLTCEDGPLLKQVMQDDPRLTRIGRLLRKSNIDELPQLFNVLKGDMSLVGPRPHAAAHNSQFAPMVANYESRHCVKPGLTGWAQVHGLRGKTRTLSAMQARIDFDIWYMNHWSLGLDFKILLRTIYEVFKFKE